MVRRLELLGERVLGLALPQVTASAVECSSSCGCSGNRRWLRRRCCDQNSCWTAFCGYSSSCA